MRVTFQFHALCRISEKHFNGPVAGFSETNGRKFSGVDVLPMINRSTGAGTTVVSVKKARYDELATTLIRLSGRTDSSFRLAVRIGPRSAGLDKTKERLSTKNIRRIDNPAQCRVFLARRERPLLPGTEG